ncbi:MAG: hypothetical protein IIA82_04515 [Thaumarchaeota archaeon]|nr:hypothetical protein [Nitrososphaerota archaeon]
MISIDLDKINSLLDELKGLKIKEAVSLRKRLNKEKEKIAVPEPKPESVASDLFDANRRRSNFMKGVWRYVKLVRDTYPELREQFTSRQMFSQFFARRRGEDVEINDVFWQNPS